MIAVARPLQIIALPITKESSIANDHFPGDYKLYPIIARGVLSYYYHESLSQVDAGILNLIFI